MEIQINNPDTLNMDIGTTGTIQSPVFSVNGKIGDVVLNYEDVGALSEDTELFSGDYNDLTNKPTIPTVPTNVSAFTNDAGYLTQHQDISGKADLYYVNMQDQLLENAIQGVSTALSGDIATLNTIKQDKLTAGDNISIVNNVISADVKLYECKLNVTTFNDITQALADGKLPYYAINNLGALNGIYFNTVSGVSSLYTFSTIPSINSTSSWAKVQTIGIDSDNVLHSYGQLSLQRRLKAGDNITIDGNEISANVLPAIPDTTNNYVLKSIAGTLTWVQEL